MNNSLQFTVFDASAALRARQLQSNLLRGQDFFGLAVNYNTFSHRRQLLFIGAYFASKLGSRGGAPAISNPAFFYVFFVVLVAKPMNSYGLLRFWSQNL